jgi:hypothetical protein
VSDEVDPRHKHAVIDGVSALGYEIVSLRVCAETDCPAVRTDAERDLARRQEFDRRRIAILRGCQARGVRLTPEELEELFLLEHR